VLPTKAVPQDVYELIEASYELPRGSREKIELLERAVTLADSHNDVQLGYDARNELLDECAFGGYPEKALVAFAWMLAQFDERGVELELDNYDILWRYKWILGYLWGFPRISHEQITKTFADFESRLLRAGYGLRTLYYYQLKYAVHRNDEAAASTLYDQWQKTKRDGMSDCTACEANFHAEYFINFGKYERALKVAKPVLDGRMSCAEVPHFTFASVLEPLLSLQRYDEAVDYYQRGYKLVKNNQDFLAAVAEHMAFLAYSHNLGTALSLLERHLPWALATADMDRRFEFYVSSLPLLERLKERGDTVVKVRVPKDFVVQGSEEGLELAKLESFIKTELADLAKQFDTRNKTDAFSKRLEINQELLEQTSKLTLKIRKATKEHG
jgi:tetratricopeptide (TPR) repeat protein